MFFNFEADEPQGDPSSPTIFSPRPISLGCLEQNIRNSGFDRIESIGTSHNGSEGWPAKRETVLADEGESSETPSGDIKLMGKVRKSIHRWRKDSWGWYDDSNNI